MITEAMGAIIGAIIAAIGGITAGAIGAGVDSVNTKKTNQTNIDLANTQFQRAKEDAVKAGFSPLVATGITPSNAVVSKSDSGNILASAIGSAFQHAGTSLGQNMTIREEGEANRASVEFENTRKMTHEEQMIQKNINATAAQNALDRKHENELATQKLMAEDLRNIEYLASLEEQNRARIASSERMQKIQLDYDAKKTTKQIASQHSLSHQQVTLAYRQMMIDYKVKKKSLELEGKKLDMQFDEFVARNYQNYLDRFANTATRLITTGMFVGL